MPIDFPTFINTPRNITISSYNSVVSSLLLSPIVVVRMIASQPCQPPSPTVLRCWWSRWRGGCGWAAVAAAGRRTTWLARWSRALWVAGVVAVASVAAAVAGRPPSARRQHWSPPQLPPRPPQQQPPPPALPPAPSRRPALRRRLSGRAGAIWAPRFAWLATPWKASYNAWSSSKRSRYVLVVKFLLCYLTSVLWGLNLVPSHSPPSLSIETVIRVVTLFWMIKSFLR